MVDEHWFFSGTIIRFSSREEDIMAREWSLKTVTNLKFRELEKNLIEVFGCIPVDYKRVIKLDVRRAAPMVQPETTLGAQEKRLVETFGCLPLDKHVIDFVDRKKKVIVKVVHDDGTIHNVPMRLIV
ncbi:MAG: hypothetical protein H6Q52_600 [Deltaproteobacteria bacterium]|nr:hypothetical protein [Deltaproteobacteria bacterium]